MQYKNILLGIATLFLIIFITPQVHAAACSGAPVDDCTIGAATTYQMPPNTVYNLNDSNGNGAIRIIGDNAILDCNGSTLNGSFANATATYAIASGNHNTTIKNCKVSGGYKSALYFSLSNKNGLIVNNSEFVGNFTDNLITGNGWNYASFYNTKWQRTDSNNQECASDYGGNWVFDNNTFINCGSGAIEISGSNVNITNSLFNTTGKDSQVTIPSSTGGVAYIKGNTFIGGNSTSAGVISCKNRVNWIIKDNTFIYTDYTLGTGGALRIENCSGTQYVNNTHYKIGVYLKNVTTYTLFENNTFYNVSKYGFTSYGSSVRDAVIKNNRMINTQKDELPSAGHWTVYGDLVNMAGATVNNLTITNNYGYRVSSCVAGTKYTNSSILNNTCNDSGTQGYPIKLDSGANPYTSYSSNNIVCGNIIYGGGHNAIVVNGYDNIICNNTIIEVTHHGIELATAYEVLTPNIVGGRNLIYGNYFYDSENDDVDFNSLPICYFALSSINNTFENNTCIGGSIMTGYGNNSYGNIQRNNIINTTHPNFTTSMDVASLGHNSILQGNNMTINAYNGLNLSSGGAHITIIRNNSMPQMTVLIKDNNYQLQSGATRVYLYDGNYFSNHTLTLDEQSMPPLTVNFYGTYYLNMSGTNRKNFIFNTTTATINITNLTSPNNDIKNVSNGAIIATDVTSFSIDMDQATYLLVGDFYSNVCNDLYTISGLQYTCNATQCNFAAVSNCTIQNPRTS